MRWIVVFLFALSLFAATVAAVAADPGEAGPPIESYGKGWCRTC